MAVIVRIPTPLRRLSNGEEKVEVPEGSLESIIDSLEQSFSGIKGRLCDDKGELRTFVNIYIDGDSSTVVKSITIPADTTGADWYKSKPSARCRYFMVEITSASSTNDVEIRRLEVEFE